MSKNNIIRLIICLFIVPFVIPIPVAVFLLWNSFSHWRTTTYSLFEYYYFPFVIIGYYLFVVISVEVLLTVPIVIFFRWRMKRELK